MKAQVKVQAEADSSPQITQMPKDIQVEFRDRTRPDVHPQITQIREDSLSRVRDPNLCGPVESVDDSPGLALL